jgi:hypothetical protein
MKQLQRLFASFVLVCVLALSASADGIIHTGTPPPPPPAASTSDGGQPTTVEYAADEEISLLEAATAVALDLLRNALTIF